MPVLTENSSNRNVWQNALLVFTEPQKIVAYFLALNVAIPLFDIPLQSILLIFAFSSILALGNAGYIGFVEKDERKKSGKMQWWLWLGVMTVGLFVCDFTGVYVHAMVDFHKNDPTTDLTFWKWVSVVFPLGGSFTLSITHNLTKRIDIRKVSHRQLLLLLITCVVLLVYAMWSDFQHNPQDMVRMISNLIVKNWNL